MHLRDTKVIICNRCYIRHGDSRETFNYNSIEKKKSRE